MKTLSKVIPALITVSVLIGFTYSVSRLNPDCKALKKQKLQLEIQQLKNRIALDTLLIHRETEFYNKRNNK